MQGCTIFLWVIWEGGFRYWVVGGDGSGLIIRVIVSFYIKNSVEIRVDNPYFTMFTVPAASANPPALTNRGAWS